MTYESKTKEEPTNIWNAALNKNFGMLTTENGRGEQCLAIELVMHMAKMKKRQS